MTLNQDLIKSMVYRVRMLDEEIDQLTDVGNLDFDYLKDYLISELKILYSNFLKFNRYNYKEIYRCFLRLAKVSSMKIGFDGLVYSKKQFNSKNSLRNSCWINVGVIGQITEIQAKIERIINGTHADVDYDSIHDAWCDLYNYCKFGIVCYEYGIIGSIYMDTTIVLK